MTGSVRQLLGLDNVKSEVARRFRNFLTSFVESPNTEMVYHARVNHMCRENRESLEVSYFHMATAIPRVAGWLADCPSI